MNIEHTVTLVTGANRGLGRALVAALLARGAGKVYAATREGKPVDPDDRVIPIRLDITDPAQAQAVARAAPDVRLLINNAGVLASLNVLVSEPAALHRDVDVNYYGLLHVTRAFAPQLIASKDAAIVNVLSVAAMASMPALGGYSASKAAAWSLTQALRGELRGQGVAVHAVFPGPIDTDMIRGFDLPKTSAAAVANAILDGVAAGTEDIAPDPMSADVLATFQRDPRAIERRFAS
jgi:NAD(P)-dependent dehydrogenase (short-subunit alcohol dehydrogenase family)